MKNCYGQERTDDGEIVYRFQSLQDRAAWIQALRESRRVISAQEAMKQTQKTEGHWSPFSASYGFRTTRGERWTGERAK